MIAVANKLKVKVSIENIAFLFKTGRNINRSLGVRAVGTGGNLTSLSYSRLMMHGHLGHGFITVHLRHFHWSIRNVGACLHYGQFKWIIYVLYRPGIITCPPPPCQG